MCRHADEEDTDCLGIFDVDVCRFKPQRHEDKVPQMGWNTILNLKSPLFNNVDSGSYTYFIHSYYAPVCQYTIASTEYILPYSSALHKDNYYATQFHPEKSGKIGEQIIRNFLEI
jgi:glutamine amidotransferase